jgi:hypothetical protein
MKTLVTILLAGALSATAGLAGALPRNNAGTEKTVPQLPFRPYQKRPDGIGAAAASRALLVTVATPQLPFRLYQKRPVGSERKPSKIETANRSR